MHLQLAKNNEGIDMLSTTMHMSKGSLNLLLFFGAIGIVVRLRCIMVILQACGG